MSIRYFKIDKDQQIAFNLPCKKSDLFRYDKITITFNTGKKKYVLYHDFAIEALTVLVNFLKEALVDQIELDRSIDPSIRHLDIGYLWNRYMHDDEKGLVIKQGLEIKYWVGQEYRLWSTPCSFNPITETWLYQKDRTITLEVTPDYRWHFADPSKSDVYTTYDEFMKTYSPYVLVTISKEKAAEWLQKAKSLLDIIVKNDSRYGIK